MCHPMCFFNWTPACVSIDWVSRSDCILSFDSLFLFQGVYLAAQTNLKTGKSLTQHFTENQQDFKRVIL